MDDIETARVALESDLLELVGDDERLEVAARTVAHWAAFEDRHVYPPFAPVGMCRRGLVGGRAYDLECLKYDADSLERVAAALHTLIEHVEATHPLARRRRQRAAAASS